MNLIELLEETRRLHAFFSIQDRQLTIHLPSDYRLPDSLRICIERHKEALFDYVYARDAINDPDLDELDEHPF